MVRSKKRANPTVICFEGIHGVGKTTVFDMLKHDWVVHKSQMSRRIKFYTERLDPRPLWPFGSPDPQIAFRAENHFMQQMIKRNKLVWENIEANTVDIAYLDRSAISVLVYSRALELQEKDFQVLWDYFNSVQWLESVLIYLEAEPETIYKRIKRRGSLEIERQEWNEDDMNYIRRLQKLYNSYLWKFRNKMKIFRIDTDDKTAEEVYNAIRVILKDILPEPTHAVGQRFLDGWV